MEENRLVTIIEQSGLEKTKAQDMLENFQEYFQLAAEWEQKVKVILVKNETQVAEMKMAREGRLFLREKRIAIEKARKRLKEQSLREGKAIDGISNVLKALIVPIEEYLEKQEKFVEIKKAEELEKERIEAERKAEEERIAREKAEEAERERIRLENEKLKKEALAREKQMQAEREKAEKEKKALEDKAQEEREKAAKEKEALEAKAQKEALARKRLEDEKATLLKEQKQKEEAVQAEKVRLQKEQERIDKGKKFQAFLSKNGYTEQKKEDFHIVKTVTQIHLFKKIDSFTF